jgi:ammonium transporter
VSTAEALDIAWILVAAALVMFMQAGFSSLESGMVRSKNSINVAAKNFADFSLTTAVYWVFGFALMFGVTVGGWFGSSDFMFSDTSNAWLMAFFIFQVGFAGTAVTIMSGAVAERMRFSGYLLAALVFSAVIYPIYGHWAWGSAAGGAGGWLEDLGFIDFAGSTVVHSMGGWMGLAAIIILGPRLGRFGKDAVPIHGHDIPMVTLGVFILWFGWFGFNGGSTLGLTADVPVIIVNTTIAGAFGALTATALSWRSGGRADVPTMMNGSLAGLVGITASANIVSTGEAVVIGGIAGVVMYGVTVLLERVEIDDAVGAVPVHLGAGIWGTLAVALFGNPAAWGGDSRFEQLLVQGVGVVVAFVWAFGIGFALLWLINRRIPLRIDPAGERMGLNVAEHGASTEILDLLTEMDGQRRANDYSTPVTIEPHTEVGQIAEQYNRVLAAINEESRNREAAVITLRERTASLQLLQTITAAVNEELQLEEAYRVALRQVCDFTGWPLGHVYAVSADGATLASTDIWQIADVDRYADFKARTSHATLRSGQGLPGEAAREKKPARLRLPATESRFPRADAAEKAGIRAGFAFPVMAGADVVAVLEFFTNDSDAVVSEPLLDLMASVGTQLGRAVERRRADETRFRTVVDHMPAMVLLRDLEGRFLLVNRRYEEFYRVANEAVQGRTLADLETDLGVGFLAAENQAHDREVLGSNRAIERELELEVEGRPVVLASVKFPIPGPSGETVALGGIEIDITERKNHEAELAALVRKVGMARDEALQATQAKSQFLANMSHELRTPMNAIVGFTRLVARKTEGQIDQQQSDNLGKILQSATHLMALINEILDLSRIESGKFEVYPSMVDVAPLLEEVVGSLEPLATTRSLALGYEAADDLESVFTDEDKLRQILVNLIGNALKFTDQGGVRVAAKRVDGKIEISVTDTGIGIPTDQLDRIFEEFQQVEGGTTRRHGGTGLGLSISNRLVQLLGGRITVQSSVGEGSTFTVQLPDRYEAAALEEIAG